MTAITFDTLKSAERLARAGFSSEQAKAIIETEQYAFQEAMDNTLATKQDILNLKDDIRNLKDEIYKEINEIKQKLFVHDWMLRFILLFQMGILFKLFF